MSRYQITIRCTACLHRYKRVLVAEDEAALEYVRDPPCPKCAEVSRRPAFDYESRKAPAIGGSLLGKAADLTEKIVTEDHKMTDLNLKTYEGEISAPKLPPRQQAMADNFFARPSRSRGGLFGLPTRAVVQAAVGGRFLTPDTVNPVAIQHEKRDRPAVHIVNTDKAQRAR